MKQKLGEDYTRDDTRLGTDITEESYEEGEDKVNKAVKRRQQSDREHHGKTTAT